MTSDERKRRDEDAICHEARQFLEALYQANPRAEDGEEHRLIVTGTMVTYDGDDAPIFSFSVRHERERSL